eukprot:6597745-Karenia_brevis.AAC.1
MITSWSLRKSARRDGRTKADHICGIPRARQANMLSCGGASSGQAGGSKLSLTMLAVSAL